MFSVKARSPPQAGVLQEYVLEFKKRAVPFLEVRLFLQIRGIQA
jgi:hypothetical protein